jgi:hypothetical protein
LIAEIAENGAEFAEKGFTTEDTENTGEFGQKLLIAEIERRGDKLTSGETVSSHGHPGQPARLFGRFLREKLLWR